MLVPLLARPSRPLVYHNPSQPLIFHHLTWMMSYEPRTRSTCSLHKENGFQLSVESNIIARLLWFCTTTLCNWLTKLAPLSQPMRCKTKTIRASLAGISPRLGDVFALNSDWFIVLFASAVIGRSNYFSFGFSTLDLKTALLLYVYNNYNRLESFPS